MEGVVVDTCKEAGMEAVCAGPSSCSYSSSKCLVTPLSTDCNYPLKPIFSTISFKTDTAAEELQGVFTYMNHWSGGESCYVGESFNVRGNTYEAGEETYYAYCVLCGECKGNFTIPQ